MKKVLCINKLPGTCGIDVGKEYEFVRECYINGELMYMIRIDKTSGGTYTATQFKGVAEIRKDKLELLGI